MNTKIIFLAVALLGSLLAGVIVGGRLLSRPPSPAPAVLAEAHEQQPPQKKSAYIGRWHSNRMETWPGVATYSVAETLTIREDGTATQEKITKVFDDPRTKTNLFRWEEKDGQLVAFCVDEQFANENGDEPEIVGVVRDDGRLVVTFLWFLKQTVAYDRVPMLP